MVSLRSSLNNLTPSSSGPPPTSSLQDHYQHCNVHCIVIQGRTWEITSEIQIYKYKYIYTCLRQAGTCVAQLQSNFIKHLIRWFFMKCSLDNFTWRTVSTFVIKLQSRSVILESTLWWLRYSCWVCICKMAGFSATNLSNIMKVNNLLAMDPIYPWWCWLQPSSARLTNSGFSSVINWWMVVVPFVYIWENFTAKDWFKINFENLCQKTPIVEVRAEGECGVQGIQHHLKSGPTKLWICEFKNYTCWLG